MKAGSKSAGRKSAGGSCCKLPPRLAAVLENPPAENPPKATYYRRAVYALALDRLRTIRELLAAFLKDSHTGRAYYAEDEPGRGPRSGKVIGRGRGIMPSLNREFPETKGWEPRPLLRAIREAKSADYFQLLEASILEIERARGEQLELFIKGASTDQLKEFPPVVYPAHKGKKTCKYCKRPHSALLHRFHLAHAFDKTHIGPRRAADRRADRRELAARLKEDIPF